MSDEIFVEDGRLSVPALSRLAERAAALGQQSGTTGLRQDGVGLDIFHGVFGTEYRVTFPPQPIWARIVGAGDPISTTLAEDLSTTATTMVVKDLSGSVTGNGTVELPPVPFEAMVGDETVTVTAVEGKTWTITRVEQSLWATTHPQYISGSSVEVLRTRPYCFNEVVVPNGGSTFADAEGGIKGNVKGAKLTPAAGKLFIQDLGEDAVTKGATGTATTYTGAITSTPAYEVNGATVPADGSVIAQLWPVPGSDAYAFVAPVPAPFWAILGGSTPSTVSTTLAGAMTKTATTLTVMDADGFPDFPSAGSWRIKVGSEVMLAYYTSHLDGAEKTWTVVRGLDATTVAEHTAGESVSLLNPGYAWVEADQADYGIFIPKASGRSSGSSPDVAGNEPAYPLSPTSHPPPGGGVGAVVLLRPGPGPSRVSTTDQAAATRYWVFDWPSYGVCGANVPGVVPSFGNVHLGRGARGVDSLIVSPTGIDDDTKIATLSVDSSTGYVTLSSSAGGFVAGANSRFDVSLLSLYTQGDVEISTSTGKFKHNSNQGKTETSDTGIVKNLKTSGGIVYAFESTTGISGTTP